MTELVAWGSERFKAFADAVVAIAMTLLILPLMEAVTDAARSQEADSAYGTADFLAEHQGQIVSFALSFVLIAVSWLSHHRLYDQVERITSRLLWINMAWMFTIVCLPVTTALLGAMSPDPLQAILYIGNLALTQITSLMARVYLMRHDGLSTAPRESIRRGAIADAATATLFLVAMVIATIIPGQGYFALFLLLLTPFLTSLISRVWPGSQSDARMKRADSGE